MLWLYACASPDADADALLRAGDLPGAAAAWERHTAERLDVRHPAADAMARRAPGDPTMTMASFAGAMRAITQLDGTTDHYLKTVDIPVEKLAPLVSCNAGFLTAPWLVAVGRSATPADAEPVDGGSLPWKRGRYVGAAATAEELGVLFASLDQDPPPRLTTIALHHAGGDLVLFLARRDGAWLVQSSSDAEAAARYVLACKSPRKPEE